MGLPLVGKAFSRTEDNFNQTEIAIFITPKIVSGADDYEKLRGNIKPFKKYSSDN